MQNVNLAVWCFVIFTELGAGAVKDEYLVWLVTISLNKKKRNRLKKKLFKMYKNTFDN